MYRWQKKVKQEPVITGYREFVFFCILIFCISLIIGTLISCNSVEKAYDEYKIEDDNCIEEIVEFGIESQTGVDIDLTPRSDERDSI